jgi:hypothetical protein
MERGQSAKGLGAVGISFGKLSSGDLVELLEIA